MAQPIGTDRGRRPRVARFVRGHGTRAGRLLWRFLLRFQSLLRPLRLPTLPLRAALPLQWVLPVRLLSALPFILATGRCLRASLRRTRILREALWLRSEEHTSELQSRV